MNIIDVLILIILVFIGYKYYTTMSNETFTDCMNSGIPDRLNLQQTDISNAHYSRKTGDFTDPFQLADYIVGNPSKYVDKLIKANKNKQVAINPYFAETQFHQDYRDTLNAFNLIVPNQRQVFNRSDAPLISESVPPVNEVKRLIGSFVKEVNNVVKNQVADNISLTGWNDMMPQKKMQSGWDKMRQQLGLETSVYTDPMIRAPIKLLKIDHLEKYQTETQTRYVAYLIIQKSGVDDQMVLKISFVLDSNDINLDREFFDEEKSVYETAVQIEEIFVIGFMTKDSKGEQLSSLKDFYNFDGIKHSGITSDKQIMKELIKKKKIYEDECYM